MSFINYEDSADDLHLHYAGPDAYDTNRIIFEIRDGRGDACAAIEASFVESGNLGGYRILANKTDRDSYDLMLDFLVTLYRAEEKAGRPGYENLFNAKSAKDPGTTSLRMQFVFPMY